MKKKINLFSILKIFVILLVIIPSLLFFTACSGESAYDIAVRNGFVGTEQEWLSSLHGTNGENGKDSETLDTYAVYEKAVELGEFNGTYLEFIKEYYSLSGDATSMTAAEAVRSVVKVYAYSSLSSSSYRSSGSGVIASFDSEGNAYVITNYHVALNYPYYKCLFYGETSYYIATFVGGSRTYDISVLKISADQGLAKTNAKAARFYEDDTIVGTECISVGNTESKGIAVSKGIVSVDSEEVSMEVAGVTGYYRVLRHDAFISHGNSGGGLFNLDGELIGITNGGIEGTFFNYALPSSLVYKVYRNILDNNYLSTSKKPLVYTLGITGLILKSSMGLDKNGNIQIFDMVKISSVKTGSNAETNGTLNVGDILKSVVIDGTEYEITRYYHLQEYLLNARDGSTVIVNVSREISSGEYDDIAAEFSVSLSDLNEIE